MSCRCCTRGREPVAGHFGLHANGELAGWFPAFDPRFAKYSPGLLHHLHLAEAAAGALSPASTWEKGSKTATYKNLLANREPVWPGAGWNGARRRRRHRARKAPARWLRRVITENPTLRKAADRASRRYGGIRTAI